MIANAIGTITNILLDAVFILIFSGVSPGCHCDCDRKYCRQSVPFVVHTEKQTAFSLSPKDIILKKK